MPPWFAASVCLTTLTTNGEAVKKCVLYYAKRNIVTYNV